MTPDDPRHGTYAGGRQHRAAGQDVCDPCRRAEARYEQARQLDILAGRPRVVPTIGTRRRLQALVALGHDFARLGEALGMSRAGAHAHATRPKDHVRATTAAKVASLYEAWSMTLPPSTTTAEKKAVSYARTVARRHGWVPPLAWDDIDTDADPVATRPDGLHDEAVVERILAGQQLPASSITKADRLEVVARWHTTGRPLADLERLGWKPDRYRPATDPADDERSVA